MQLALRPYVIAGVAMAGASLIAVTPVAPPLPDIQVRAVQLADASTDVADPADVAAADPTDVTLVMGGSGTPIPPSSYVTDITDKYVTLSFPDFTSPNAQPLFTPEGLSPIYSGIKSLPFDTSVGQGVTILNSAILDQVAAGNSVAVSGESQSATINSLEMAQLAAAGNPVPADDLHFVLTGDPSAPNGGLLERFDGLYIPSLGITFSGATPPDTIYPTDIYTLEYDGYADFPQYPIDLPADLNAFAGIEFVHPFYPELTPAEIATKMQLPTDPAYGTDTTYYLIPTENLPLLDPLRDIPVVGNPLADLIQPDLKVIVNLGYGDPDFGYSTGPANEPTEFGLFPPLNEVIKALGMLVPGAEQGVQAFMKDVTDPSALSLPDLSLSNLSHLMTLDPATALTNTPTDIINALTSAVASAYATLLPTADIALAIGVTLPAYDATLFVDNLSNPLDAIGLPVAADTGLLTLAGGIELLVVIQQVQDIMSDLTGLIP